MRRVLKLESARRAECTASGRWWGSWGLLGVNQGQAVVDKCVISVEEVFVKESSKVVGMTQQDPTI